LKKKQKQNKKIKSTKIILKKTQKNEKKRREFLKKNKNKIKK
jgi:hypothetical protein